MAGLLAALSCGVAAAQDNAGFIFGTVKTTSDKSYTGTLRWDDEEAFWDDHFNSAKEEMPYLEEFGKEKDDHEIRVLGRKIKLNWGHHSTGRQFISRFGEIASIKVLGNDEARLFMRDGTEVHVEGSANDVSADISIDDDALGQVSIPWKRIDTIEFSATPSSAKPEGFRMHGKVETTGGTFTGFIQWDSEECLSYDKIDGEDEDIRVSIEMGKIRSIERHTRKSARLVLLDGRSLVLDGTNDVDDDIRGILVEDPRFGRVEIGWDAFRKVTFDAPSGSGKAYDAYGKGGALNGKVTTRDGKTHSGRLVFDLDEAYTWEMLDGNDDDISYTIPFGLIESIAPRGSDSAIVRLRGGEEIELEDTQDVSDQNDGILILAGSDKTLVAWDDLEIVEFE